jgi:hypothetical protein
MNIRDFLISLNEEQNKPEDTADQAGAVPAATDAAESSVDGAVDATPAASTLQPSGAAVDVGAAQAPVEAPVEPITPETSTADQPESNQEAPTADSDEGSEETDEDDTKKRPSQAEFHAQTDLPEESVSEEIMNEALSDKKIKQIKQDIDSGMSYDRIIGKHANARLSNTDDIRKVFQQHAWENFKKNQFNSKKSEESVQESMTADQKDKKEEIFKALKDKKADFEKRYGDKAEEVMHATATKQAMNEDLSFTEAFEKSLLEGTSFKAPTEGIRGLMESQGLEEEFTSKAVEIFESAIAEVAKDHVAKISKYAAYVMEHMVAEKLSDMEDTLDSRLTEAVSQWHADNQIGIEQGVRVQVAESMMDKLALVLKEHFVEVPDYKKDLYEENLQVVSVQGLQLKESIEKVGSLTEEIASLKKSLFIESSSHGMTMLQKEKLKELTEGLVYESEEDFAKKFEILKESLVDKKAVKDSTAILEDAVVLEETKPAVKRVDSYIDSIASHLGKYSSK